MFQRLVWDRVGGIFSCVSSFCLLLFGWSVQGCSTVAIEHGTELDTL